MRRTLPPPTASLVLFGLLAGACHGVSFRVGAGNDFRSIGLAASETPAGEARRLSIRTNVGDLRLETRDVETVRVEAQVFVRESRAGDLPTADAARDLLVRLEGDTLRIENAHLGQPDERDWKMDLVVAAPPGLAASLRTGVGDVTVKASTASLEIDVGVGDVTAIGSFEVVAVRTGTGDATVRAERLEGGSVKTGVGDLGVRVSGEGPASDLVCETGTGDIGIEVPASFAGSLDLQTGVGDLGLVNAAGVSVRGTSVSKTASGSLGEAVPIVRAKTGVGDLGFKRR